jgi:hypothetical protein
MALPSDPVALALLGVFALVALLLVAHGARTLVTAYRLYVTAPTPVAEVANVSRPVEVTGEARPHDGTVTAPFTGTASLVVEWAVLEERPDDDGSDWETVASDRTTVPFRVDDGEASVLVDPADADLHLSRERRIHVDSGDVPPEPIRAFLDGREDVDGGAGPGPGGMSLTVDVGPLEFSLGSDRRYVESRLDPGEPVFVYGTPTYAPGESRLAGEVNARFEGAGDRFLIADASEDAAFRRVAVGATVPLAIGLFVLLVLAGVALS